MTYAIFLKKDFRVNTEYKDKYYYPVPATKKLETY